MVKQYYDKLIVNKNINMNLAKIIMIGIINIKIKLIIIQDMKKLDINLIINL